MRFCSTGGVGGIITGGGVITVKFVVLVVLGTTTGYGGVGVGNGATQLVLLSVITPNA